MSARNFVRFSIGALILIILAVTLFPVTVTEPVPRGFCLFCGSRGVADAILNVLFFVPLGVALAWYGLSVRRGLLVGLLLSSFIEVIQFLVPGRDSSLGDVLFNTLGVVLAVVAVRSSKSWLFPAGAQSARFAFGATIAALAMIWLTAFALQPTQTRSVYYGQWTPVLGHLHPYEGEVLEATLGPLAIVATGALDDSDSVRALIRAGAPWRVRALAGPRVPALASLVTIYDEQQREIVLIGPDRDDLVFRSRMRTAFLLLDQPDLRLVGALRGLLPGDTMEIAVRHMPRGLCMSLNDHRSCGLGFSAGDGWALFLYPESLPAVLKRLLAGVWMAALFFPASFWARTRRTAVAAGALLFLGLGVLAPASGLMPSTGVEYAGAIMGFGAGAALAWAVVRLYGRGSAPVGRS